MFVTFVITINDFTHFRNTKYLCVFLTKLAVRPGDTCSEVLIMILSTTIVILTVTYRNLGIR